MSHNPERTMPLDLSNYEARVLMTAAHAARDTLAMTLPIEVQHHGQVERIMQTLRRLERRAATIAAETAS